MALPEEGKEFISTGKSKKKSDENSNDEKFPWKVSPSFPGEKSDIKKMKKKFPRFIFGIFFLFFSLITFQISRRKFQFPAD